MNQQQRKLIAAAVAALSSFSEEGHIREQGLAATIAAVDQASGVFEAEAEAEREKFDNMPEGLKGAEKGQAIEVAAEALEAAFEELSNIDLSEGVAPEAGWEADVAEMITQAIDAAENME